MLRYPFFNVERYRFDGLHNKRIVTADAVSAIFLETQMAKPVTTVEVSRRALVGRLERSLRHQGRKLANRRGQLVIWGGLRSAQKSAQSASPSGVFFQKRSLSRNFSKVVLASQRSLTSHLVFSDIAIAAFKGAVPDLRS
jgi:hypothetical protein